MEHIVYSEIWNDRSSTDGLDHLRVAIPYSRVPVGSLPNERQSFIVDFDNIGFVQFDFFGFIKDQIIYQAAGLYQCDPNQLPLPLVKLVAEPLLVTPSPCLSAAV